MNQRKAQITRKGPSEFEVTRTHVEIYDRTGLLQRRRQASAEMDSIDMQIEQFQQQRAALQEEITQIDALLSADKP